jgi:hypothetical protein
MTRWALIQGGKVATVVEQSAQPTIGGDWVEATVKGPGWGYVDGDFVPPSAIVPQAVTMRQARLALLAAGVLGDVQTAITAMDEPARTVAQITWDYSTEVQRQNGLVSQLAPALGLTESQVDDLFIAAAQL